MPDSAQLLVPGIAVQAGALSKLALTASSNNVSAGLPFLATLSATDAYGNPVISYTGTVHFSSSDSQAALPSNYTFTNGDKGAHSFSIALDTAGSESVTASDVSNSSLTSTWNATVAAGVATALQMTIYPATIAGAAHSFSITAVDAFGNTSPNYVGTVSFSSSDAQAGLPASYTFVAADAGAHLFSATLKTAGNQSLTIQDLANHLSVGQTGITVSAAVAHALLLSGLAGNGVAGAATQFTISAIDAFGNVATTFADTVHFTSSDAHAALPVDYTFSAVDHGAHQFNATLLIAGTQTLQATDISAGSITSAQGIDSRALAGTACPSCVFTLPTARSRGAAFTANLSATGRVWQSDRQLREHGPFQLIGQPGSERQLIYTFAAAVGASIVSRSL